MVISFLPNFRLPYQNKTTQPSRAITSPQQPYNLCVLGDSYNGQAYLHPSAFNGINRLTIGRIDDMATGKWSEPATAPRSILVLETAERLVRTRFATDVNSVQQSTSPTGLWSGLSWIQEQSGRLLRGFCRDVSADMEFIVFDYGLLRPLKEARAALTYQWFGRLSEGVGLSANGHHLYLAETIKGAKTSSFAPINSKEVDAIVRKLNRINQRAHALGYCAVFLSIIPNPVSVIEPKRSDYNHLIERIEQHTALQMGVISLYSRFRTNGSHYYHPSDSHWNQTGVDTWVMTMNQIFNRTACSDAF